MNFFFDSFDYFVYENKQKNIEQNFIVYILCFLFIFFLNIEVDYHVEIII